MDDNGHREYGRHKSDHYKAVHSQWMIPPHQMKDQTIKIMSIIAERDNAIYERNLALSEKKAALAERDMAIVQRDAAIAERNSAIAALEYARENAMNANDGSLCSPACPSSRGGSKNVIHENQNASHVPSSPQLSDSPYSHAREMPIAEAYPISSVPENDVKPRRVKCTRKETKTRSFPSKKVSKSLKKSRRDPEDLNRQVTIAKSRGEWRGQELIGNGEDLQNEVSVTKHEWKDQDLGLNQVIFDETTMSPPGCSCTGTFRQCYKWGNGGWQSACCTTMMSMYPLPVIPNKRHARVGGRKMSGSAFTKLLSRLAREGHDLSVPVDLKNHWAKHGTNRYITIR